jgi:hypothetical protein
VQQHEGRAVSDQQQQQQPKNEFSDVWHPTMTEYVPPGSSAAQRDPAESIAAQRDAQHSAAQRDAQHSIAQRAAEARLQWQQEQELQRAQEVADAATARLAAETQARMQQLLHGIEDDGTSEASSSSSSSSTMTGKKGKTEVCSFRSSESKIDLQLHRRLDESAYECRKDGSCGLCIGNTCAWQSLCVDQHSAVCVWAYQSVLRSVALMHTRRETSKLTSAFVLCCVVPAAATAATAATVSAFLLWCWPIVLCRILLGAAEV